MSQGKSSEPLTRRAMASVNYGRLSPDDSRHGTPNGYANYKCRCDRCRTAQTAYMRERGIGPYRHDRCACGNPKVLRSEVCVPCYRAAIETPHGSESRARRCKCDECRAAAAAARAERRKRPNVRVHGNNGYANGCRCDICREGHNTRTRERRRAQRAAA